MCVVDDRHERVERSSGQRSPRLERFESQRPLAALGSLTGTAGEHVVQTGGAGHEVDLLREGNAPRRSQRNNCTRSNDHPPTRALGDSTSTVAGIATIRHPVEVPFEESEDCPVCWLTPSTLVVAKWLGHSHKAAARHDLMSRDRDFEDVVNGAARVPPATSAGAGVRRDVPRHGDATCDSASVRCDRRLKGAAHRIPRR